jgi:hypothetical protein
MLTLYHCTPSVNLLSILSHGLQPKASRGKLKVVWLCSASKLAWALNHLAEKKGKEIQEFSVLKVQVYRTELVRRRRGIWYTTCHIPAWRLYDQLSC